MRGPYVPCAFIEVADWREKSRSGHVRRPHRTAPPAAHSPQSTPYSSESTAVHPRQFTVHNSLPSTAVYTLHFTVRSLQPTLYSSQSTVHTLQFTVYSPHFMVHNLQSTLSAVVIPQCAVLIPQAKGPPQPSFTVYSLHPIQH